MDEPLSLAEVRAYYAERCRQKRLTCNAFTDRKKAKRIASTMSKQHGTPFTAYRCRGCGFYHIGRTRTAAERQARLVAGVAAMRAKQAAT
jgi:hypothetical protein